MRGILWLAVITSVVVGASLTKIHNSRERGTPRQKQDDEIFIILQKVAKPPPTRKPKPWHNPIGQQSEAPKCLTDECKNQSTSMSRMMDPRANPCTDFYQYACGGWLAEPLPPDQAKWSLFAKMAEQTEARLRYLIEQQKDSDNEVEQLVYKWYAACTNRAKRDSLGAGPLQELIKKTMKSQDFTPFVDSEWSGNEWSLEETLGFVHRNLGVSPLFRVALDIDPRNSSSPTYLAIIDSKPLLEANVHAAEDAHSMAVVKAYVVLMARLTVLLGAKKHQSVEQIIEELNHILLFEAEIDKEIMGAEQPGHGSVIEKWAIQDFPDKLPGFDWKTYFSALMKGISNDTVLQTEEVFVEIEYLQRIIQIVKNTPKRTIANFITWSIIHEFGPFLSTKFHDAYLEFASHAYGIKRSSPLWQRCVRGTEKSLDMGVSRLFVKDSGFSNESLNHADQMVQQIRQAFLDNLETVTWMDDVTKQAAKEKVEAMIQQIGYPQFIMNSTALKEYFEGMEVNENNVFQNRLNEISLRMKNTLVMRGKPLNRYSWAMSPFEINAYYAPNNNKIVVPAGILRPPFYHFEDPHSKNFGAIGFVVGHELTHGFDTNGAQFDGKGNLKNWWTNTSLLNFVAREQCLVDEYSQCEVEGHHLSGQKTLGENTADNGGLKLAYQAYQKWLAKHDHETTLPNLGLSSDQLFFLSFAQIWCEKTTPDYALTELQTNPHSPGRFRVDVTLKNSPDFARAFNCPIQSEMNPAQKCAVW